MVEVLILKIQKLLVDISHILECFHGRSVSSSVPHRKQIKDVEGLLLETNMWSQLLIAQKERVREIYMLTLVTQSLEPHLRHKVSLLPSRKSLITAIIIVQLWKMTSASSSLLRKLIFIHIPISSLHACPHIQVLEKQLFLDGEQLPVEGFHNPGLKILMLMFIHKEAVEITLLDKSRPTCFVQDTQRVERMHAKEIVEDLWLPDRYTTQIPTP